MRNIYLSENVKLIAKRGCEGKMNFYLSIPHKSEEYVFTRAYTKMAYKLCKSGIRVNVLLSTRCRSTDVMNLVKYVRHILPSLVDEFELTMAA